MVAKIDADTHRGTAERYGVKGFPTIKYFHKVVHSIALSLLPSPLCVHSLLHREERPIPMSTVKDEQQQTSSHSSIKRMDYAGKHRGNRIEFECHAGNPCVCPLPLEVCVFALHRSLLVNDRS